MRQKDPTLNLAEIMKSYNPEGFSYGSNDSTYDYNFSNPNDAYSSKREGPRSPYRG